MSHYWEILAKCRFSETGKSILGDRDLQKQRLGAQRYKYPGRATGLSVMEVTGCWRQEKWAGSRSGRL